ncbi:MAG TPA: M48 family metalloprotease [Armatimonadota bacterium]|jgi:heat shock protein HtpX
MPDYAFNQGPAAHLAPREIDPNNYRPPEKLPQKWLFEDQIAANTRGTYLLMFLFTLVLVGLVSAIALVYDRNSAILLAIVAAVVAFFTSYFSFYYSDSIVLQMSQAMEATKEDYPHYINTLEGLTLAAGLPQVPKAYVIFDSAPNAFATGRDPEHAAVAVTTGLLDKLDRYQLEGVLAHEMSHIADRDILLSTVAAIMVGIIVLLSDWVMRIMWFGGGRRRDSREGGGGNPILLVIALLAIILAPIIAQFMRMAISRKREYLADSSAIKLTRYPEGLAGALETISKDEEPLEIANKATAHLFISNPLHEHGGWLNGLFDTHPPIEERIARLRAM